MSGYLTFRMLFMSMVGDAETVNLSGGCCLGKGPSFLTGVDGTKGRVLQCRRIYELNSHLQNNPSMLGLHDDGKRHRAEMTADCQARPQYQPRL